MIDSIWLRREAGQIVVLVEHLGRWVEVIRESADGPISHIVEKGGLIALLPQLPVIKTDSGEIRTAIDGTIISDTTPPPPADTTIHEINMPYMPGGVGVNLDVPGQPLSVAEERREMEKPEGPPHKVG